MKGKWIVVGTVVVLALLALGVSLTQAQEAQPQREASLPAAAPAIGAATPLSTTFTYQGQLKKDGAPVNAACDFQFGLYDDAAVGSQVGVTLTQAISVTDGLFTARLDFGVGAFNGEARWLAVVVRCPTGSGTWAALAPRQPLTTAPYALALPGLWTQPRAPSPNVIGGHISNTVGGSFYGATIGGGGASGSPNRVYSFYGTVGGGRGNTSSNSWYTTVGGGLNNVAGDWGATVSGGEGNDAGGGGATIGGGYGNIIFGSNYATIGGGAGNSTSGLAANYAAISGGYDNSVGGYAATIGGGWSNLITATHGTIAGGYNITVTGNYAAVPGGAENVAQGDYSLAAGYRARALHSGAFVWADSTGTDFASTAANQFLVHASGGVGINTNSPGNAALRVAGTNASGSDNTATFANTALDPTNSRNSHVHWGTTGDWYIRSAVVTGTVILQDGGGNVGIGTASPQAKLHVNGIIRVDTLGSAGGPNLCLNGSNEIASCSSSLRYKTNVADLDLGLATVAQLRPVTFDWRDSGEPDLGFVAEEVDAVAPLLTTRNDEGQVEGVKYDRLTAVLVNAVQEQQQEIAELQAQNARLAARLAALETGGGSATRSGLLLPGVGLLLAGAALGVWARRRGGGL